MAQIQGFLGDSQGKFDGRGDKLAYNVKSDWKGERHMVWIIGIFK